MNMRIMEVQSDAVPESGSAAHDRPVRLNGLSTKTVYLLGQRQAWNDVKSSLPLISLDALAVLLAVLIGRFCERLDTANTVAFDFQLFLGGLLLLVIAQFSHGLYPGCGLSSSLEFRYAMRASLVVCAGLAVALMIQERSAPVSWFAFGVFALALVLLLVSLRPLGRRLLTRFDWWAQPVIIVGSSSRAMELYARMSKNRFDGLRPVGIVFNSIQGLEGVGVNRVSGPQKFIGPLTDLEAILIRLCVCRVVVADVDHAYWHEFQNFRGIPRVTLQTDLGHHPTEKTRMAESHGRIELHCRSSLTCPCSLASKRALDLFLVLASMPIWLPLCILLGLMIRLSDPGPIFYKQTRVGRFGKPFRAIKFRSMVVDADRCLKKHIASSSALQAEWRATHKLKHDPRITPLGDFLRKTSLDEIPQLWNVLMGDMSLVGPRPLIDGQDYDKEYIQEHPEIFELYTMVRPGVTGMWQISGRNSLPYKQRVYLDRFYLLNWSLGLDIFILWRTVKTTLLREGAY